MNSHEEKFRLLMDDVLPPPGEDCGPSRSDVMEMLRSERQRRRGWRVRVAVLGAILAATGAALPWRNRSDNPSPVAQVETRPSSVTIREVNDEQLLTLLRGTPTALMEWPDGDRTLFVIER
jgi:hypothetical protein